jgi:hypothetical protein
VSTRCYVGAADPAHPHLVHARFVLVDGHPAAIVPVLARIWAGHAHRDTRALVTAVLAHDWEYLDNTITADTTSSFAGQQPVPGVGMTLATTTAGVVDPPEPASVFPLRQATHLDATWIYLIDPDTATATVHSDDGDALARYRLDICTTPRRRSQPHVGGDGTHEPSGIPRHVPTSPAGARR